MPTCRFAALLLTAPLFAGCATIAPQAEATPTYMAIGTEPFWALEVTPTGLNFNRPSVDPIMVANPGWRTAGGVRTIRTERLRVTISPGPCSDGMSDRRYADTAVVVADGATFRGCGGGEIAAPAAGLERTTWRITMVNGRPAVAGVEADIAFADGRVSGTAGCNRFSGPYTQARDQLNFGNIASTRMACAGPIGDQEVQVLALMQGPLTVRFGERLTMIWTNAAGSRITLQRIDRP